MAEPGPYIKVSHGMPEHPKIAAAGGDAGWLFICLLAYASRNRTDGIIPESVALRISDRKQPAKLAGVLVTHRLMHRTGHDCPRCVQPLPGNYVIHDYLKHQRSAAHIEEVSQKRAANGSKGGSRRAANAKQIASPGLDEGFGDASSKTQAAYTEEELRSSQSDTDPPKPPQGGGDESTSSGHVKPKPRRPRQVYDYGDDAEFAEFWAVFPEKSGKPEAYSAWLKALDRGAEPRVIIKAAERYRDAPDRDPKKTKFPQGWLNAERYIDSPSAEGDGPCQFDYPDSPYDRGN